METGCLFMQSNPSCSSYVSFRPTAVNAKNMVKLNRIFSYMEDGNGTVVVVCHVCGFGGRVSCFLGFVQKFRTYHFDGPHFRKNKNHTIKEFILPKWKREKISSKRIMIQTLMALWCGVAFIVGFYFLFL